MGTLGDLSQGLLYVDIQRIVHCDYSYNENQRDALFLNFF